MSLRYSISLLAAASLVATRAESSPLPAHHPAVPHAGASSAALPNVVILLADDIGYHDLGVQGMRDIPTPNIDALARGGVRFTDGYMVSPLCSPSRAGILTGKYPERWGQELNPGGKVEMDSTVGIPHDIPLLSERLKSLGYATGIFGKWHEGEAASSVPTARGFDEFFGFLGAEHAYKSNMLPFGNGKLFRGTQHVKEDAFLTDAFSREAVRFIRAHARQPFFLYVPFNAIHEPIVDDESRIARVRTIADPTRRRYASLLVGLDDAVGQIVGELERRGLTKSTVVLFMSDNGGPTGATSSQNTPLRGVKGNVYEGGIRVPFIINWPGRITPGSTYSQPVSALDVAPTILAGILHPAPTSSFDGVDLLPFLARGTNSSAVPHAQLFWRMAEESAVREGRWKLLSFGHGPGELFDLQSDIGESHDVRAQNPKIAERLSKDFQAWAAGMQPPRWGLEHWKEKHAGGEH